MTPKSPLSKNTQNKPSFPDNDVITDTPVLRTAGMASIQNETSDVEYTRRLIPRILARPSEIDEHFDVNEWYKKVYGPDIVVVSTSGVPDGWILVDGATLILNSS